MRDKLGGELVGNVRTWTKEKHGDSGSKERCVGNEVGNKGHADLHSSLSTAVRGGWGGRRNKSSE